VTIVGRYTASQAVVQRLKWIRRKLLRCPDLRQRLAYARFVADWTIRCEAWDAVGVYRHMLAADVGIYSDRRRRTGDEKVPSWKVIRRIA